MKKTVRRAVASRNNPMSTGFSLFELLVSVAMFLVIGGIGFNLFNTQQASSQQVQGQAGLNLALRNAAAQLQMDVANAGSGYFQEANIPSWPVGVSIVNNVVPTGSSCYNGSAYTASCFDQLNIITAANPASYPPVHATDSTGGTSPTANCSNTSTGIAYSQAGPAPMTLAQTAGLFSQGDQVLFLTSKGLQFTAVVLTQAPVVSGNAVKFTFNSTNADGSNGPAWPNTNDPLDITTCDGHTPCTEGGKLANPPQFCGGDWILKLAPITYQVNSSNSADPILTRTQNGVTSTVMEQVIGFKIGATIWNASTDTESATYNYVASSYTNNPLHAGDVAYNFTLVRSVRISLIGRTAPNPNLPFRNNFDNGPYQVQGMAVVINPRNMSMND
jgi:type II secretory pathway pseudopilin PulG